MKKRNRLLSMLLTVTMITAQLPASPVIAAADDGNYQVTIEEVEEEDAEELIVPDVEEEVSVDEETLGEQLPIGAAESAADVVYAEDVEEEDLTEIGEESYIAGRVTAIAADAEEAERVAAAYNANFRSNLL